MDNLTNVRPDEIPEGFSSADPNKTPGARNQINQKEAQQQALVEQALTPDALARLGTIKLVKPEKASAVEAMIVSAATSGKIVSRINEGKLIEMLEGIGAKKRQPATINIQRKKYAFDSDDEEDNDDDLL